MLVSDRLTATSAKLAGHIPLSPSIPLPRGWRGSVRAGLLHAVALARVALLEVLAGFETGSNPRAALFSRLHRAEQRCALMEEELRIKDACMAQLPARTGRTSPRSAPPKVPIR